MKETQHHTVTHDDRLTACGTNPIGLITIVDSHEMIDTVTQLA